MKKIFIISFLLIATGFHFTACKSDSKKEENKDVSKEKIVLPKKSTAPLLYQMQKMRLAFLPTK